MVPLDRLCLFPFLKCCASVNSRAPQPAQLGHMVDGQSELSVITTILPACVGMGASMLAQPCHRAEHLA